MNLQTKIHNEFPDIQPADIARILSFLNLPQMGQGNTQKIGLVCFPAVVGGDIKNQYGFFNIEFDATGQPMKGEEVGLSQLPDVAVAIDLAGQIYDATFLTETIYFLETVDLDTWNKTLNWHTIRNHR